MTILIVDDNPLDRRVAGECVTAEGLEVRFAEDGREALDMIEQEAPDVVLTDLQMPNVDGLELVETIRQKYAKVPVILMTAFGSETTAVDALNAGAASYVPKVILKQELPHALRVVLTSVEARKQREQVREFLQRTDAVFELGYEPNGPTALAAYLQEELERLNFCDEPSLFQISTALTEALTNAIDHGNLELDSVLRESGDGAYRRAGVERSQQSPYRDRRVRVSVALTPDDVTFVVRDEGAGFDPSELPDPRDPANLLKASGRGIMLIRTFMDEVTFNDVGNEITMVKRRSDVTQT